MNSEKFDKLVNNYDSHDEIYVSKMAFLIEKYPYFQLPRFLYAKSLKDQNKNDLDLAINQLALYSADRGVLKESIEFKHDSPLRIRKMDTDVESTIEDYESKKIESSLESNIKKKSITPKKELPNLEIEVQKLQKDIIPQELVKSSKKILLEKSESKLKKSASIKKDLRLSFLDWIQFTEEKQINDFKESKKEEPLIGKLNVIDRFIEADPIIPPVIKFSKSLLPLPFEHTSYSVGIFTITVL